MKSVSLVPRFALLLVLFPLSASAASLGCKINQTDSISLKARQNIVENMTNNIIKEGTVIDITSKLASGKSVTDRVAVTGTLRQHGTMSGGDTRADATSCTAQISSAQSTIDPNKKPPVVGGTTIDPNKKPPVVQK